MKCSQADHVCKSRVGNQLWTDDWSDMMHNVLEVQFHTIASFLEWIDHNVHKIELPSQQIVAKCGVLAIAIDDRHIVVSNVAFFVVEIGI